MKNPVTTHHETLSRHPSRCLLKDSLWFLGLSDDRLHLIWRALCNLCCVAALLTFGGPSAHDLFHLPFTLIQTLILLVSSFTAGLAGASAHRKNKTSTLVLFGVTFLLGIFFYGDGDQLNFLALCKTGNGWDKSAFLSAYFTLVGTHGVHVLFGLLWIIVLLIASLARGRSRM